jgi:hypothetical protein
MSKIVQAVNAMLSHPDKISTVQASEAVPGEIFFLYNNKFKWSIKSLDDGHYGLWFYPEDIGMQQLVNFDQVQWSEYNNFVYYSDEQIGTRESRDTFAELYSTVREKLYGVDKVLDEIIEDDIPF